MRILATRTFVTHGSQPTEWEYDSTVLRDHNFLFGLLFRFHSMGHTHCFCLDAFRRHGTGLPR